MSVSTHCSGCGKRWRYGQVECDCPVLERELAALRERLARMERVVEAAKRLHAVHLTIRARVALKSPIYEDSSEAKAEMEDALRDLDRERGEDGK